MALAAALLPRGSAWGAAVGALALLAIFTVAIAVNLARGRRPDCRCFGQIGAGPIGRSTLARNGGLMAVAGFVVAFGWADPGPSVPVVLGSLAAADGVGLAVAGLAMVVAAAAAFLALQLLGRHGQVLLRLEAIEARLEALAQGQAGQAAAAVPSGPGRPVGLRAKLARGAVATPHRSSRD